MTEQRTARAYRTTIDRAGWAVATGGGIGGLLAVILSVGTAGFAPLNLLIAFALGWIITAMTAVALGGPVWLAAHAFGHDGPGVAALVGAMIGFALFFSGQTYGFGLYAVPVLDPAATSYRWISAAAIALMLAGVSSFMALAMWRVAYRRAG